MAQHDDKAQAAQQRAQEKLQKTQNARVVRGLRDITKTPDGREFLWWLLKIGKVGTQPFTSNALHTAFQCGELNVGQQVLDKILSVNPAVYVQMQQEHYNEYQKLLQPDTGVEHGGSDDGSSDSGRAGHYEHPDA